MVEQKLMGNKEARKALVPYLITAGLAIASVGSACAKPPEPQKQTLPSPTSTISWEPTKTPTASPIVEKPPEQGWTSFRSDMQPYEVKHPPGWTRINTITPRGDQFKGPKINNFQTTINIFAEGGATLDYALPIIKNSFSLAGTRLVEENTNLKVAGNNARLLSTRVPQNAFYDRLPRT